MQAEHARAESAPALAARVQARSTAEFLEPCRPARNIATQQAIVTDDMLLCKTTMHVHMHLPMRPCARSRHGHTLAHLHASPCRQCTQAPIQAAHAMHTHTLQCTLCVHTCAYAYNTRPHPPMHSHACTHAHACTARPRSPMPAMCAHACNAQPNLPMHAMHAYVSMRHSHSPCNTTHARVPMRFSHSPCDTAVCLPSRMLNG